MEELKALLEEMRWLGYQPDEALALSGLARVKHLTKEQNAVACERLRKQITFAKACLKTIKVETNS